MILPPTYYIMRHIINLNY
ncbi:hypothetical protein BpHYR1_037253 [Brachionus plicatilis]|uniref:Uncharacterized protein n=1 Tax=Brachionus plicatilis TaxID=10195 RepID=A0A3M7PXL1_BRAPC|nr:hypothetical protein BpHYR1_037253 [Brachionus plicatilis]